ncbi:hypothetical protein LTR86_002012 [Recurvomyces mirabilis]|nr:hypothetical protein LTR86_002012 [Recurvomyces mirabilis]
MDYSSWTMENLRNLTQDLEINVLPSPRHRRVVSRPATSSIDRPLTKVDYVKASEEADAQRPAPKLFDLLTAGNPPHRVRAHLHAGPRQGQQQPARDLDIMPSRPHRSHPDLLRHSPFHPD